jgi:hypothetical protein
MKGQRREKIRRGGHKKKNNENGKSEGIIWERSGFKKKRRRVLGLRETICDSGSGRNMGRETKLGKNKKVVTERV